MTKLKKPGPGRELKLTTLVTETVCQALRLGQSLKYAAVTAGIGERTLRRYIADGKAEKYPEVVAFVAEIKKAEAEFIRRQLMLIQKAGINHWQAAAWLLERRFPNLFSADRRRYRARIAELEGEIKTLREGKATESDIEAFIARIVAAQRANS
jgi:hypothetical protein